MPYSVQWRWTGCSRLDLLSCPCGWQTHPSGPRRHWPVVQHFTPRINTRRDLAACNSPAPARRDHKGKGTREGGRGAETQEPLPEVRIYILQSYDEPIRRVRHAAVHFSAVHGDAILNAHKVDCTRQGDCGGRSHWLGHTPNLPCALLGGPCADMAGVYWWCLGSYIRPETAASGHCWFHGPLCRNGVKLDSRSGLRRGAVSRPASLLILSNAPEETGAVSW